MVSEHDCLHYDDSVLVVIVNYRTPELTIDCLKSLTSELETMPHLNVIVTDNLSGDDSIEVLERAILENDLSSRVHFMPLESNGGFAYGNNAAIRSALESDDPPKYILLLNPDTVVRPGGIVNLVQFMNANPNVGISGSRLEDPDGTPQKSAFRFPSMISELEKTVRLGVVSSLFSKKVVAGPIPASACSTDWVAGASMLIRREVFDAIGLLDEGYFMYFEEVDFCLRAQKAGWPCWYVPNSRVVHLVGQASGVTDTKRPPRRRPNYWFESRRRYFLCNRGAIYTLGCDAAFILGTASWRIRRLIQRKPENDPPKLLFDFCRHSVFLRGFAV